MTPEEHKELLNDILKTLKSIRDGLFGIAVSGILLWMVTMTSCTTVQPAKESHVRKRIIENRP